MELPPVGMTGLSDEQDEQRRASQEIAFGWHIYTNISRLFHFSFFRIVSKSFCQLARSQLMILYELTCLSFVTRKKQLISLILLFIILTITVV